MTYDQEFVFHFTAAWADVQEKAKRIKDAGHVRVVSSSPAYLVGEVQGDTNIYQSSVEFVPGTRQIATWDCGCAWAAYSWGRSGRWKKYEGRYCSHVQALIWEGQSRGMYGREIEEDVSRPEWMSDPTIRVQQPGDYKKPEIGEWRMSKQSGYWSTALCRICGDSILWSEEYEMWIGKEWELWCPDGYDHEPDQSTQWISISPDAKNKDSSPAVEIARDLLNDGQSGNQVMARLRAFGVQNAPTILNQIQGAPNHEGLPSEDELEVYEDERYAELKEDPEPALPATTADEELEIDPMSVEARSWINEGDGDMDIADAAKAYLRNEGMRKTAHVFSFAEQQELINEGEGDVARNIDDLDIEGTHYAYLEDYDDEDDGFLW